MVSHCRCTQISYQNLTLNQERHTHVDQQCVLFNSKILSETILTRNKYFHVYFLFTFNCTIHNTLPLQYIWIVVCLRSWNLEIIIRLFYHFNHYHIKSVQINVIIHTRIKWVKYYTKKPQWKNTSEPQNLHHKAKIGQHLHYEQDTCFHTLNSAVPVPQYETSVTCALYVQPAVLRVSPTVFFLTLLSFFIVLSVPLYIV